jgi:hypothetical protein
MSGQAAGYSAWKSPVSVQYGVSGGHIRPFTNKDPTNNLPAPFGKARPLKHYRRGRAMFVEQPNVASDRLMNRQVTSGKTGATIANLIDRPGSTMFSPNADACQNCPGTKIVSSYLSNPTFLTDNQTPEFREKMKDAGVCFNPEKKARNRCRAANTLIKNNYYTTLQKYRYSRCKTFEQQSFNFAEEPSGDPHTFLANCSADTNCKRVTYKPSNQSFAHQGAVDSSLVTSKLRASLLAEQKTVNKKFVDKSCTNNCKKSTPT